MKVKGITDEDFVNYKVPSMYIATATCSFKCDAENGYPVCQNSDLANQPDIFMLACDIAERYRKNKITKAVIFGGLEPFDQFAELATAIAAFRMIDVNDDIVIYTGYNKDEIKEKLDVLKAYPNIVVKFGRYIPGQQPHFDEVLGVYLSSDNQFAERIS